MIHPHPDLAPPGPLAEGAVRVLPLGGLGEIGRNMTVIEHAGQLLVIDCGVLFPDEHHPGIDLILPDFTAIADRLDDIQAIVLTHGHEDHIGGVPYLVRAVGAPLEDGLPVQRLAAELDWAAGQLKLGGLLITLPGKGQVSGALDWSPVAGSSVGQARGRFTLKDVDPAQLSRHARSLRIGGSLALDGEAQAQRTAIQLMERARRSLEAL